MSAPNLPRGGEVVGRSGAAAPARGRGPEGPPRGIAVVELFMAPGDIGRVIGRQGRTAQAVRSLVALTAERAGSKAQVEFRELR